MKKFTVRGHAMPQEHTPPPFWHRLNTFFAFPFQPGPLVYATVLALCSLVSELLFFLPDALALLLVELGILLAASRYGFKVVALGSRGIARAADFPRHLDEEWQNLPWKLFAILVVQSTLAGWLTHLSPRLGWLALFVLSFTLPATVVVLVQSCSFWQALHPGFVWETMRTIGRPYALLCFFLFLLSGGAEIAMALLLPLFNGVLLLPVFNFAFIYFSWVMASLLGYTMYQHHEAFGIALLPGGGVDAGTADRRTPEQVAQRVAEGDLAGALGIAYEDQRIRPDDLAAQRRYHRMLLLAGKVPTLLDHGERFIALLQRRGQAGEALAVYKACQEKDAGFAPGDAPAVLALARAAWLAGDARAGLALLAGFDKRFRGHEAIPQAYELVAHILVKGLGRGDKARPILATLEARYPGSPQTQEVRWLLRDSP